MTKLNLTNKNWSATKKLLKLDGITVIKVKATLNGKQLYMLQQSGHTDGILLTAQEIMDDCKNGEVGW